MNTTAAALQAHVTVATIRTWCRHGVVTAIKQAGRWIIDTASLTARIAIGAMRTRKDKAVIDLNASYTFTHAGASEPTTITPIVKRRTSQYGGNIITVKGLIPLFADRFDAITDEGARLHALTVFSRASIAISDVYDPEDNDPQTRDGGRLRTSYRGDAAGITVDDVLDLAARLRDQLAS